MQVFVYGTLTEPARADSVLDPEKYSIVGEATLDGLERVEGVYPTLVPGDSVAGRLLAVDENGLARLDEYEGVDRGLYVRVSVPHAETADPVWTYVGDPARLGVDGTQWPGERSFDARVREYCSRIGIVVRPHE